MGIPEIKRLIDGLTQEEQEKLAAQIFEKLSPEARSRVLGIAETSLTVVTGSFVSLNSDVAVNIQNSNSGFDAEALIKALIDYRKTGDRNKD